MKRLTSHLKEVDETYFEHMAVALSTSVKLFLCSLACFIHGFFPFLFEKTSSKMVCHLHDKIVENRKKK